MPITSTDCELDVQMKGISPWFQWPRRESGPGEYGCEWPSTHLVGIIGHHFYVLTRFVPGRGMPRWDSVLCEKLSLSMFGCRVLPFSYTKIMVASDHVAASCPVSVDN